MKSKRLSPPDLQLLRDTFDVDSSGKLLNKLPRINAPAGNISGSSGTRGYLLSNFNGKLYKTHHIIYYLHTGCWADMIDHINGDTSDNRIENLRSVSYSENARNQKLFRTNKSGTAGVHYCNKFNLWIARIHANGKRVSLGRFQNKDAAILARKEAEIFYGYHANHGLLRK